MSLKLRELSAALRKRITDQIAAEDRALGRLEAQKPEPITAPALVCRQPKSSSRLLSLVVSVIRVGKRSLDSDNLQGSLKPLRDAIAIELAIDDADPRLSWQYGQQQTKGTEGVIVMIETI